MIFPKFDNMGVINLIRDKYDPLANHVRPHITLVFPFYSEIDTIDLKKHITSVLQDFNKFEIILSSITPTDSYGKYLFLNIQKGKDEIIQLHKRLYTGILESYYPKWIEEDEFLPHMTVGRFEDEEKFKCAINDTKDIKCKFKSIVNEISVEIIDENEDSIIEFNIDLN
ncbi:MAG: 2'-5' RNA ligase family protein [Peptostreptococcaceae bacterium]